MTNVVSIGLPKRPNLQQRQGALMRSFARHRRTVDDVFWLKENAELLNVLATGDADPLQHDLDVYRPFYDTLEERLKFFPQYYRFLLSMCLDLEELGLSGSKGEALCARVRDLELAEGEISDLQRAEAQRLLARRGCGAISAALRDRLTGFMAHSRTFAVPNKKAAYELTHIVYYLSEYGADPISLSQKALTSLEYAGLLAYLDQDVDLLAEVCVALRFAGQTPSHIWEDWLKAELNSFVLQSAPDGPLNDAYHEYLVTSWWAGVAGKAGFPGIPAAGGVKVLRARSSSGPLRAISELMYQLGAARCADWGQMRDLLQQSISKEHHQILEGAARSSANFDSFFAGFSRAY